MRFLAYAVWVVAAVVAFGWGLGVRHYVRRGEGVQQGTVNTAMLLAVALVLVPILRVSPFHLLWAFPLSMLLGSLWLLPPFSLLSIPGWVYGRLVCLGLNAQEVTRNKQRYDRYEWLVTVERLPPDEAIARLRSEGLIEQDSGSGQSGEQGTHDDGLVPAAKARKPMLRCLRRGGSCLANTGNTNRLLYNNARMQLPVTLWPWPLSLLQDHSVRYSETVSGDMGNLIDERKFTRWQHKGAVACFLHGLDPATEVLIRITGKGVR